jgi:hypothetical protein
MATRKQWAAHHPEFPILDANALYAGQIRGDGELPALLHLRVPLANIHLQATASSMLSPTSSMATKTCMSSSASPPLSTCA